MHVRPLQIVCVLALLPAGLGAQGPPGGRGRGGPGRGDLFDELRVATITGAPFTGVQSMTFQQTLANGDRIVRQAHATVYRDSAGRVRIERTIARHESETPVVTIVDPVAGAAFRLDTATMTATEMKIDRPASGFGGGGAGGGRRGPHGPAAARGQEQDLGTKTIGGVVASGTRTTQTIPAGSVGNEQPILVVRETWFSNDLKMPVIVSVADPRDCDSVTQFSRIVLGEPDAALFQVPSGYTISAGRRGGSGRGR
jgi:hypothetical protein